MSIKNISTNNDLMYYTNRFIDSDNDVFYDSIESFNIDANGVFQAQYNYGPQDEQITKKNIIINFFQTLVIRMFEFLIYPGASFIKETYIDMKRVEISQNQLKSIGGKSVKMRTPDGDIIDGIHIKAHDFKNKIEKYFEVFKSFKEDGLLLKQFILKKEFIIERKFKNNSGNDSYYLQPKPEAIEFLNLLLEMGFNINPESQLSDTVLQKNANFFTLRNIFRSLSSYVIGKDKFEEQVNGYCLELTGFPEGDDFPSLDTGTMSNPTVLITGGVAASYAAYKGFAVGYLMRGFDVMMIDFRGYGNSEGRPNAHKTKLDVETAYQYLAKEHGVKNKDLLLHGHCFGAAPAADLAARRKGVSILLDRSFSKFENVASNQTPLPKKISFLIKPIIRTALPWIIDYNNSENLKKIQGHIAIVMDRSDAFITTKEGKDVPNPNAAIPESEVIEQIDSLPSDGKKVLRLLDSDVGHIGSWINNVIPTSQLNQFLKDIYFVRKVFA